MTERLARTHSHASNRAKPKQNTGDRKVVYKSVLDNPFRIAWPHVPINLQNLVFANLLETLHGVSEVAKKRDLLRRKAKKDGGRQKDPSSMVFDVAGTEEGTIAEPSNSDPKEDTPPAFALLSHLTIGINAVTKQLESQSQAQKLMLSSAPTISKSINTRSPVSVVFVCRADVDPPLLIAHLPHLVAVCNRNISLNSPGIILMPLPKGSEQTLAEALGIRRVAVLGIDVCSLTQLMQYLARLTWYLERSIQLFNAAALVIWHSVALSSLAPAIA